MVFTNVNECMANVNEIFFTRERILGCKPEFSQSLVWTTNLVSPEYELEIKCIAALYLEATKKQHIAEAIK